MPRSPMSAGVDWASRISTIGLSFSLPALLGHYLDGKLGTKPGCLLVGMVLGFAVGLSQIVRLAGQASRPK